MADRESVVVCTRRSRRALPVAPRRRGRTSRSAIVAGAITAFIVPVSCRRASCSPAVPDPFGVRREPMAVLTAHAGAATACSARAGRALFSSPPTTACVSYGARSLLFEANPVLATRVEGRARSSADPKGNRARPGHASSSPDRPAFRSSMPLHRDPRFRGRRDENQPRCKKCRIFRRTRHSSAIPFSNEAGVTNPWESVRGLRS